MAHGRRQPKQALPIQESAVSQPAQPPASNQPLGAQEHKATEPTIM